jgi:hypothetical protein
MKRFMSSFGFAVFLLHGLVSAAHAQSCGLCTGDFLCPWAKPRIGSNLRVRTTIFATVRRPIEYTKAFLSASLLPSPISTLRTTRSMPRT